jgi:hypothetical protein
MTFALTYAPGFPSTASAGGNRGANDFLVSQWKSISDHLPTLDQLAKLRATAPPGVGIKKMVQPRASSFEERIFDTLVALKVAVSQYAMHLGGDERARLFEELDSKINVEDWHEDDTLPTAGSFIEFLKWMIYAKRSEWSSIGVSSQGTVLVAWRLPNVLLTANFEAKDSVRWTAQIKSPAGDVGYSVGKCTLRLFAEQAMFYLK